MRSVQFVNERIRGPNLAVLVKRSNGVPFEEGLRRANEGNLVIASYARLKVVFGSDEWKKIHEAFPCWSGTMTAYVEPDVKLPEKVEYIDPDTGLRWVFHVPEQHRGKTNAILVVEHPDYTLEIDGNNRVVHATSVDLVENFPAKDGPCKGDPKHGLPTVSQSPDYRLWRISARVGPASRSDIYSIRPGGNKHILACPPSVSHGMVVEAVVQTFETPIPIQLKLTRESPDTLIINGTPEHVDAAVRLFESTTSK